MLSRAHVVLRRSARSVAGAMHARSSSVPDKAAKKEVPTIHWAAPHVHEFLHCPCTKFRRDGTCEGQQALRWHSRRASKGDHRTQTAGRTSCTDELAEAGQ
mmetsp:Transcript_27249/g.71786  ORF Transcript_27249/g.71786 Transcript_27249/m.71786 type:complete len:101 (-) Transcript_27249:1715-2017(-)